MSLDELDIDDIKRYSGKIVDWWVWQAEREYSNVENSGINNLPEREDWVLRKIREKFRSDPSYELYEKEQRENRDRS